MSDGDGNQDPSISITDGTELSSAGERAMHGRPGHEHVDGDEAHYENDHEHVGETCTHDHVSLAVARHGSLYPDHVVFLGPGIVETEGTETAANAARRTGRPDAPLVVVPGAGVLLHNMATSSARALARCLADVTCRVASDDSIDPLSPADEAQLLDWDAEKYRQSLDQGAP